MVIVIIDEVVEMKDVRVGQVKTTTKIIIEDDVTLQDRATKTKKAENDACGWKTITIILNREKQIQQEEITRKKAKLLTTNLKYNKEMQQQEERKWTKWKQLLTVVVVT